MTKNTKKIVAATTPKAAKAEAKPMHFLLPDSAKEGEVYTILPEGVFGKERWFHNKQYGVTAAEGGRLRITITPAQLKARGMPVEQATEIPA